MALQPLEGGAELVRLAAQPVKCLGDPVVRGVARHAVAEAAQATIDGERRQPLAQPTGNVPDLAPAKCLVTCRGHFLTRAQVCDDLVCVPTEVEFVRQCHRDVGRDEEDSFVVAGR